MVDLAIGNVKVLQTRQPRHCRARSPARVCDIDTSQADTLAQQASTASSAQTICAPARRRRDVLAGRLRHRQHASPSEAPVAGTPNNPTNPVSPMNPLYPSEQPS